MGFDVNHWSNQFVQPAPPPDIKVEIYGYPVTLDPPKNASHTYRIAVWMPGQVRRSAPLIERRFPAEHFSDAVREYARKADMNFMPRGTGPIEAFMLEWFKENHRAIVRAHEERERGWKSYITKGVFDPDQDADFATRSFVGEDGRLYEEIDPVLSEALYRKSQEEKDAKRLAQEARERRESEQRELEALPGFASF